MKCIKQKLLQQQLPFCRNNLFLQEKKSILQNKQNYIQPADRTGLPLEIPVAAATAASLSIVGKVLFLPPQKIPNRSRKLGSAENEIFLQKNFRKQKIIIVISGLLSVYDFLFFLVNQVVKKQR